MTESVDAAARCRISAAHEEFVHRAGRAIARGDVDELHEARIAAKRLRYTIEFFECALGPTRRTAGNLLAHLQDRLGAIADDAAFARFYRDLERELDADDPRMPGLESLIAAGTARREATIASVRSLWGGGEYPPYSDMLAAAISAALCGR